MVERRTVNPKVAGSNPARSDYFLSETCWKQFQINIDADVPTLKLYGQ